MNFFQKYLPPFAGLKLALLGLLLIFMSASPAQAQWLEPNRIKIGASLGFGGLHAWGKPSFDVVWYRSTLRVSPGLYYMSAGLSHQIAHFDPKRRTDRIIILNFYYHNDWLLSRKRSLEFRKDQHIYMLLPGIRVDLNHLGTIYFEVSGGPMYMHERIMNDDKSVRSARDYFGPMGEIRIGGTFLSRKEHHQDFPPYQPKVHRRAKKKLEFKQK